MAKITDLKGEWAVAVGRAMIAFGSIEHVTVVCLRNIPRDPLHKSTAALSLVPRVELLLEILAARPGKVFSELANGLSRIKPLAKIRNLIAHNPLVLQVFEAENGDYGFKELIVALHKEQSISLPQLQKFADEAEQLAAELLQCSSAVFSTICASATTPPK